MGRWLALAFGATLQLQLLVSLGIALALLALAEWTLRLWVQRTIAGADPRSLRHAEDESHELADFLTDRIRANERRDWRWALRSTVWGALAVAAPLTLLPWWRHGSIHVESTVDALDIGAMGAAVIAYSLVKRHALEKYRCPTCGGSPRRLESPTPRFGCLTCEVTWRVGP